MNIFDKLQKCRVELNKSGLKKTGQNKFSGYDYFELGDFLPMANKLFQDNKLCGLVAYGTDKATLTIVDTEKTEDKIEFTCNNAEVALKGSHAIQNIGATQTYQRRYLYMTALEISDSDALDSGVIEKEGKPEQTEEEIERQKSEEERKELAAQLIDEVKLQTIKVMLKETFTNEEQFREFYNIPSLEFMDNATFVKAMEALTKKKKLMKKTEPKQESLDL